MADVQSCPRPAQEGTNLLDLFAKVPALLETCRHAWPLQAAGIIRALRLVSKDMGPIVMRTAQSCGVQVGEGAWPNPSEVVRLMSHAVLRSMDVTILIRSGEPVFAIGGFCRTSGLLRNSVLYLSGFWGFQVVLGVRLAGVLIDLATRIYSYYTSHF